MRHYIVIPAILLLSGCAGLTAGDWAMGAGGVAVGTQLHPNDPPKPETYIGEDGKEHPDAGHIASNRANELAADTGTNFDNSAGHLATSFKDNLYTSAQETKDWLFTPPKDKPMHAVPYSYCYNVLQDILCYRRPMPGWEDRIVAYQGTGAPPPPPSITQPLPHVAHNEEKSSTRIAEAKPVFAKMPSENKEDSDEDAAKPNMPAQVDSAHETLPDPALAPQL